MSPLSCKSLETPGNFEMSVWDFQRIALPVFYVR